VHFKCKLNFGPNFAHAPPAGYRGIQEQISYFKENPKITKPVAVTSSETKLVPKITDSSKVHIQIHSGIQDAFISDENHVIFVHNYPTIAAKHIGLKEDQWYFEVSILPTPHFMKKNDNGYFVRPNRFSVGIFGSQFIGKSNKFIGVGDGSCSWSIDNLGRIKNEGNWDESSTTIYNSDKIVNTNPYTEKGWTAIGCALNLNDRTVSYYGIKEDIDKKENSQNVEAPVIGVSKLGTGCQKFIPAVSALASTKVEFNFGEKPFKMAVPKGFKSVNTNKGQ
jgi:hypothetical protein